MLKQVLLTQTLTHHVRHTVWCHCHILASNWPCHSANQALMNNWDQLQMITSSAGSAFRLGRQPRHHHSSSQSCCLFFSSSFFLHCLSSVSADLHMPFLFLLFSFITLITLFLQAFCFHTPSIPFSSIPSPLGFYSSSTMCAPPPLTLSFTAPPTCLSSSSLACSVVFVCLARVHVCV